MLERLHVEGPRGLDVEPETRASVTHGVCPDCAAKHLGVSAEEFGS